MPDVSLIVADPGHFHAALVQKEMYPNLSPKVHVYAPLGPDLADYLTRVARFNTRKEQPTHWKLEVHAGPDFLERMCRERLGTIAIFSGRNRGKVRLCRYGCVRSCPWRGNLAQANSDRRTCRRGQAHASNRRRIALSRRHYRR